MNQKYILEDKNLSMSLEKKANELNLLQKKRKTENLEINMRNINNGFIFQKDTNFSIYNIKKIEGNINQRSESENDEIAAQSHYINFERINSEHFCSSSKEENIKQYNNNQNLFKEMKKRNINDFFIKNKFKENIQILSKDQSKESSNNQISHFLVKSNYFNVIKEEKPAKKINKIDFLNKESNNEIRVLKNNKVVYINKDL